MEMLNAIRNSAAGLGIFAVVTAGAIALTQISTEQRIADNIEAQQAKALYEIVPRTSIDNDLLNDTLTISKPALTGANEATVFRARRNGLVETVIMPVVAPDGYTGAISLIVGINRDDSLAGVRVLAHKETPGLGDKVELKKSDWILSFNGQHYDGEDDTEWAVKKDGGRFDQFTGATITPRAIVNATKAAVRYFRENKTALLDDPQPQDHQKTMTETTGAE
ncbi:electron transport complex subunit RsxG [Aliamphritea hakodatensis]|uniref:electron transport complex subunit RsxG n=1 Tax=Aliamphritea hakodatensis TaxID=2895352 RepID=UPI0022FD5E30|nr:electron transport complex subunit RsxG [Aliamphritea hakodatensis]